ncbi:hypothetical protein PG996_014117 [Apiospora saccharicola]|uniref:2EXR domain-containing protein n=1 Tax=Apiospora saccharicola TaxID=335842 RepID=A0ABR1TK64_9PEZI
MAHDDGEKALDGRSDDVAASTANPKLEHQGSEDILMSNATDDVLATPQHIGHLMLPGSASVGHRPQTRSMTRNQIRNQTVKTPIFTKLEDASSRSQKTSATSASKLEDSEDINYSSGGSSRAQKNQSPKNVANVNSGRTKSPRGTLRKSPRSRRKTSLLRESTPANQANETSHGAASEKPCKRRKSRAMADPQHPRPLSLRRSARLSKPLTEFQKYSELPNELKFAIWEAACEPRLVYIRNRQRPGFSYDVQNTAPTWFDTDAISAQVASERYRKMFGLHNPDDTQTEQYVNPDMDIVMFEPCCSGCRSYHCARMQITEKDRLGVRQLAVQTESPFLMANASPCWVTVSLAWPCVETLYLMRTAITGDSKHDKVMVRVNDEGEHERALRKRFDEWKKQAGLGRVLTTLTFVSVMAKAGYTGAQADIIIG